MPKIPRFPARKQPVSGKPTQSKSLDRLIAERDETIAEIERRDAMPLHLQVRYGNTLETRLASLDRQIADAEAEAAIVSERLERLDSVMQQRDHAYVFAVRGNVRIKICIQRRRDGKYLAGGYFGRRMHWDVGNTPSSAFRQLHRVITWMFDRGGAFAK